MTGISADKDTQTAAHQTSQIGEVGQVVQAQKVYLQTGTPDYIYQVTLNRPDQANALHPDTMRLCVLHLKALAESSELEHCRALVLHARGKHFSAGADLNWMRASARYSQQENREDARKLTSMFEALAHCPVPSIALVQGCCYGGALGLLAACDVVLAHTKARFCLSETKLGLLPAVILPYLARKMTRSSLTYWSHSAGVFSAADAKEAGLVHAFGEDLDAQLREQLARILRTSPEAQRRLKSLLAEVYQRQCAQGDYTAEAIAQARTGVSGQAGLEAFFEKKDPPWMRSIEDSWGLN